eukprot:TRINITY_DN502_c0_g1_i1.p1 TRINITY_DN502_c0_g1~~TRINITY_DN502_c0_g1_i1.p1  ORF type:complete len:356 (+),score=73.37 TRINITY_DN502_c0_g1_i1:40-1107(+)
MASSSVAVKLKNLLSVIVIEKDVNNDLTTWTFPSCDSDVLSVIKSRSGLLDKKFSGPTFRFSRFSSSWHYIQVNECKTTANSTNKVASFAVAILAEVFNPAKYSAMCDLFSRLFQEKYSPLPIMDAFLSIFVSGKFTSKTESFDLTSYDDRRALIAPVKDVFSLFGLDTAVIWLGVLLKKRIFVYAEKIEDLLSLVRCFPMMGAFHRLPGWITILRPYMTMSKLELEDMTGVYICGFTESSCVNLKDKYDVFIDVPNRSWTIADHAKADFVMTNFHKDQATAFLECAEKKENDDQAVIKEITLKTNAILSRLQKFRQEDKSGFITMEVLSSKKLPVNVDRFLYSVAVAEGMVKSS